MSIQAERLNYTYSKGLPHESRALKDVSFHIEKHSITAIIGHTGSGKSTLLQMMNGLLKPDSGRVLVDEECVSDGSMTAPEISRKVGLVFQYPEYQLFEETIARDVAFGPKNLGVTGDELDVIVDEALRMVGLDPEEYRERSPFELSGGQKRRVAIAGVIAMRPQYLILDEPTAGLDPTARREILDMIRDLHEQQKITILFVSHNMTDIAEMADHVMVLDQGELILDGEPRDVLLQEERLRQVGLRIPPVSSIMQELAARTNHETSSDILRMDEAAAEILQYLKK